MTDPYVLGVDLSTTACKAIAFDRHGETVVEAREPFALIHTSDDGWEQDAETWYTALLSCLRSVSALLGDDVQRLAALCITHQRETVVVTDPHGRPQAPALVWMDARCREQVNQAVAALGSETLHQLSGKPPCTTPSLYKLMYLLATKPKLAGPHSRVLDVHGFAVWRLTGRFATSLASADPLGIIDMQAKTYAEPLLALMGLQREQFPELVAPGSLIGGIGADIAPQTGLPAGLPVIAGAGDGQCAGLGAGIVQPGSAYLNLGTAIVSGVLSAEYCCNAAFRTLYGALPDTFFLETDLKGGSFTLDWLAKRFVPTLAPSAALAMLEAEATGLAPGAQGLVVVPYWHGVMNPYWDDNATGIAVGWTGSHGPAHLYRAILEGIAMEQRLHSEGVQAAVGLIDQFVVLGGGSRSNLWCQILADVLGTTVVRARSAEATALGAAILAASYSNGGNARERCGQMTGLSERFEPQPATARRYDSLYRDVYRHLYPALKPALGQLAAWRAIPSNTAPA